MRRFHLVLGLALISAASFASPPCPGGDDAGCPRPARTERGFPTNCDAPAQQHLDDAWQALSLNHVDDAQRALVNALHADPHCQLARGTLGALIAGPEGTTLFETALASAPTLQPVERLELERLDAERRGQLTRAADLAQRQAQLAPDVVLVHLHRARVLSTLHRWEEASDAAHAALALSPRHPAAWNLAGYAQFGLGHPVEALTALHLALDAAPLEPNAWDSLGEGLLAVGRPREAAQAFQKALALSHGRFTLAWQGLAAVQALEGDWTAARDALAAQRAATRESVEQLRADLDVAWTSAAERHDAEARRTLDAVAREARGHRLEALLGAAATTRAHLALLAGHPAQALEAATAAGRLRLTRATPRQQREHRARTLALRTVALARLHRAGEATRTLTQLRRFLRAELDGPLAGDLLSWATGAAALASGRPEEALDAWLHCSKGFDLCRLDLLTLQERRGSPDAAATAQALLTANHRDAAGWLVRARVEEKRKVSADP